MSDTPEKKYSMNMNTENLVRILVVIVALLVIMKINMYVRSSTLGQPTVLDYDPWWWYRHAEEIIENNMVIPEWDELSHFPPGRPMEAFHGWSYTLAIMYKLFNPLLGWSLTTVAQWSTIIFAMLSTIPAYLIGRKLSNHIGGLSTALFASLTPGIVSVSMAGYCDTDMAVVFYSLLSVYSILIAMEKKLSVKNVPYYIFAILVNLIFVFTWGFGWIALLFFTCFIPALFAFRMLEQVIHNRKFKINLTELKKEADIVVPLLIIILVSNILGTMSQFDNILEITRLGMSLVTENLLLVNVSVAELQQLNIFTQTGFESLVSRVGFAPTLLTVGVWPMPILTSPLLLFLMFKLYKKLKIRPEEIFLLAWAIITFLLILRGVRFSLLFGTAAAVAAGYVIGSLPNYIRNEFIKVTFYGIIVTLMLAFVSTSIYSGYAVGQSLVISDNWYDMLDWLKENADPDSLVATWWDPGHIIAGYTGLRVHADGAHCGEGITGCIPYDHDDRIQDMGKVFAISDENEAVLTLEKYRELSDEQCQYLIDVHGSAFPTSACGQVPEIYVIASSDLIQKYYWLSYFGTGTGDSYIPFSITGYENGVVSYGNGQLSLIEHEGAWVAVLNLPESGIRNVPVSEVVYYVGNQKFHMVLNDSQVLTGLVWVEPSYNTAIFMGPATKESMFTRMFFFDGEGLEHFELVYENSETKIFRVIW